MLIAGVPVEASGDSNDFSREEPPPRFTGRVYKCEVNITAGSKNKNKEATQSGFTKEVAVQRVAATAPRQLFSRLLELSNPIPKGQMD